MSGQVIGQTIWTGEPIIFERSDYADWDEEPNQDRITDSIWIARRENSGIFNAAREDHYLVDKSPTGTEWSFGTTAEYGELTFSDWKTAVNSNPPAMLNKNMVLHLIGDDIYLDIKFLSWTGNAQGGGFSYERSTEMTTNTTSWETDRPVVYPNPVTDRLFLKNTISRSQVRIVNAQGILKHYATLDADYSVEVSNLSAGIYFLLIENESCLLRVLKH